MNKRSIAVAVAKHPIIKKLLEARLVESSIVSRLIVEELNEAERQTLSNKLGKLIKQAELGATTPDEKAKKREEIIVKFFQVLQTGDEEGYGQFFPTWSKMSAEKKKAFIEAGKKFDYTKSSRAKKYASLIMKAVNPTEVEAAVSDIVSTVDEEIPEVELETGTVTGEKPGEKEGTPKDKEPEKKEPELVSLNKDNLDTFIEVFGEFRDNFKRVQYLDEQAGLLLKLLGIVKTISGKGLSDLDKRRRAYTRTLTTEAPERGQRDIIVTSGVVLRHMDTLEDVLQIYKRQSDAGTVGSNEMFRKYGDGNPRKYLTFLLNKVVIKDLNSLLNSLSTAIKRKEAPKPDTSPETIKEQEEDDVEAIIDAVTKAYQDAVVEGEKLVLLLTKKATKPETPTEPTAEPPDDEKIVSEVEGERREEQPLEASIIAATGRIYDILQPITKYFSQVNPFGTDMGHDEVLKDFRAVVKGLVLLVGQINEYAKDGDITVALARAAQTKLQAIKNFLLKTFGLTDSAKKAGETGALNDVGDGDGFVESGAVDPIAAATFDLNAEGGAGEKPADPAKPEEEGEFDENEYNRIVAAIRRDIYPFAKFKNRLGFEDDEEALIAYRSVFLFLLLAYAQGKVPEDEAPISEQILRKVVSILMEEMTPSKLSAMLLPVFQFLKIPKENGLKALMTIKTKAPAQYPDIENALVNLANKKGAQFRTFAGEIEDIQFSEKSKAKLSMKKIKNPTTFINNFLKHPFLNDPSSDEEPKKRFSAEKPADYTSVFNIDPGKMEKIKKAVEAVVEEEDINVEDANEQQQEETAEKATQLLLVDKEATSGAKEAVKKLALDVLQNMIEDIKSQKQPEDAVGFRPDEMDLADFEELLKNDFVQSYLDNQKTFDDAVQKLETGPLSEEEFNNIKQILLATIKEEKVGTGNIISDHFAVAELNIALEDYDQHRLNYSSLRMALEKLQVLKRIKSAVEKRELEQARALLDDIGSKDTYDDEGNLVPKSADEQPQSADQEQGDQQAQPDDQEDEEEESNKKIGWTEENTPERGEYYRLRKKKDYTEFQVLKVEDELDSEGNKTDKKIIRVKRLLNDRPKVHTVTAEEFWRPNSSEPREQFKVGRNLPRTYRGFGVVEELEEQIQRIVERMLNG